VDRLNVEEKKLRSAAAATSESRPKTASSPAQPTGAKEQAAPISTPASAYKCDGRTHCSQMSSCSEAKYFLANCPGVKMDGDKNGIPCEQQWCGR
jgi:Excalibur calcium-binding domain